MTALHPAALEAAVRAACDERWGYSAKGRAGCLYGTTEGCDCHHVPMVRAALTAGLTALDAAGWQLVPKVATEEMQLAMHDVISDPQTGLPRLPGADEIYAAMLAAAPKPDGGA